MFVSQKCQYALRALYALARHEGNGLLPAADIAQEQAIPLRFLEVIMAELKQGGFVGSQRGRAGGYRLAQRPPELSVGRIIRFMDGPLGPVGCAEGDSGTDCPLRGGCVFLPMWQRVRDAMSNIYDGTTLQDLVERRGNASLGDHVPQYSI